MKYSLISGTSTISLAAAPLTYAHPPSLEEASGLLTALEHAGAHLAALLPSAEVGALMIAVLVVSGFLLGWCKGKNVMARQAAKSQ